MTLERDLEQLRQLDAELRERELGIRLLVAFLRGEGVPWSRIGEALGVARQSAWRRFR